MVYDKKVYGVAMSGGVDSSVVAYILKDMGHEVFGVTMNLHEHCKKAIEDAKIVCSDLGIKHYVCDLREEFSRNVVDVFASYYERGLTPNPCAFCNRDIKMGLLLKFILSKGADMMATGHYVRNFPLREHINKQKDQSYFLSMVSSGSLNKTEFPLENVDSKIQTRNLAKEFKIHTFEKTDSQDICFIPNNDHKGFLKSLVSNKPGDVIHIKTGKILGKHNGISNYTIGQRKGLGISYNEPLHIVRIDANSNIIYVGDKCLLDVRKFVIRDVNWLIPQKNDVFNSSVKLRSSCVKNEAVIQKIDENTCIVELCEQPFTAVTRGQICAMYSFDTVIGAGIID